MSELVKRLRAEWHPLADTWHVWLETRKNLREAADRIEALEEALQEIARWNMKPWTDMADADSQQLQDIRHALTMVCALARKALEP